jgi:uncharacterized protein YvpB
MQMLNKSLYISILSLFSLVLYFILIPVYAEPAKSVVDQQSGDRSPAGNQHAELSFYLNSIYAMTDQEKMELEIAPFLVNETTLFPVRVFAEHFGAKVTWIEDEQRVDIRLNETLLTMYVGNKHLWINGAKSQEIDIAPGRIKGTVLLPLRVLAETMDKEIFYHSGLIIISSEKANPSKERVDKLIEVLSQGLEFSIYQNDQFVYAFASREEAVAFAKGYTPVSVRNREGMWVWDNFPPFSVYQNENKLQHFNSFKEASDYAKNYLQSSVRYKKKLVWSNRSPLPLSFQITGVPIIYQMPQLQRGCEVTALAMMLNYAGTSADKMKLARQVKKDPTPFQYKNGGVYFGNPNTGFVGDIYSFSKPGYGVYHGPIKELAERYLPERIIDLTDSSLDDILFSVSQGKPVWVINNTTYNALPSSQWRKWGTPAGDVYITYKEHSVLVTGYDDHHIYFHDPLGMVSKAHKAGFEKGWNQMGKQAITYVD